MWWVAMSPTNGESPMGPGTPDCFPDHSRTNSLNNTFAEREHTVNNAPCGCPQPQLHWPEQKYGGSLNIEIRRGHNPQEANYSR